MIQCYDCTSALASVLSPLRGANSNCPAPSQAGWLQQQTEGRTADCAKDADQAEEATEVKTHSYSHCGFLHFIRAMTYRVGITNAPGIAVGQANGPREGLRYLGFWNCGFGDPHFLVLRDWWKGGRQGCRHKSK